MKKVLLPLLAVCCLAPVVAFAGQQHPLVTDTAETVAPSKFEAETAIEYVMFKTTGDTKVNLFLLQETVTGGIIPGLDAFVALPVTSHKIDAPGQSRETGLGDIVVGAKWGFAHVDKTAFAVKPFVVLPTGDDKKGLGEGGFGFGAVAVATMELSKELNVDGNIKLAHQETTNDSYNELGLSVAAKYEATKELKVVGELETSKPDTDGAKWSTNLAVGGIYAVQKNLDVDLGVRVGLSSEDSAKDPIAILAGVTFKF